MKKIGLFYATKADKTTWVAEKIQKEFGKMQGDEVKSAPKGFSKDHERIELLRKKQYLFIKNFTDEEVLAKDFPQKVAKSIQVLQPFLDYMTEVLTTDENGQPLY